MANPEHVAVVQKGAAAIEEWKQRHPGEKLNLQGAYINDAKLEDANLADANLQGAELLDVQLTNANLANADLSGGGLLRVTLAKADLSRAKLAKTLLFRTDFLKANLFQAKLPWVSVIGSQFVGTELTQADLSEADVHLTSFVRTDLSGANLSKIQLIGTTFLDVTFHETNLVDSIMANVTIGDCDISPCVGLDSIKHQRPSSIGLDTLTKSFYGAGGCFTHELELFFLNAGVPKQLLDGLPMILKKIEYCTSFVCYGQPDIGFADWLVKDLKARGAACWLYSLDATPGERTWKEITLRRREAEKMIVLCSAKALVRDGVLKEIEEQIDEDPDKMIPISLDNLWKQPGFLIKRGQRDLKPFLLERNYADFSDNSKYEVSLNRLLKGIKRNKK